ncbi:MAG TPA: tetratricopeptide repeat protein, partial [Sulfuricurvum sp.]|nr:tetratricopeptide repeat protein [Sulfuricurvum sp.]
LDSANDWAKTSLGASYLDRGQYDESIKMLSQIKESLTARILEATAYAKKGEMKLAVNFYFSIIDTFPEEEMSVKNIPLMYNRMILLQTFKPFVMEHRDKARTFESNRQYREALSELSEALKIADDTEAQEIQGSIFNIIRRNPLLAEFSEMPEDARRYALRSEMLLKDGNLEQAAAELKKAIRIAPYAARLYYSSALINAELKKYPEAISQMKIYLKAVPEALDARAVKDEIMKWEFRIEKGR